MMPAAERTLLWLGGAESGLLLSLLPCVCSATTRVAPRRTSDQPGGRPTNRSRGQTNESKGSRAAPERKRAKGVGDEGGRL